MTTTGKKVSMLTAMNFDITAPLKVELQHLELRSLNIMTGLNGSGKSFFLKTAFALCCIGEGVNILKDNSKLIQYSQEILEGTFYDFNANGRIGGQFGEASLTLIIEEGKVKEFLHSGFEAYDSVGQIKFLSTEMRKFTALNNYLAVRKGFSGPPEQVFLYMLEHYRLYDITYVEGLIAKMPIIVDELLKETLKSTFNIGHNIISLGVDLDKAQFYACIDTEENKKNLAHLSAGEQSLINMIVGTR
jgi:hypothetical protein